MNSKQVSIVLGVIVVILLAVVGYMALRDNPQSDTLREQNTTTNSNLTNSNANTAQPLNNTNTSTSQTTAAPAPTAQPTISWKDTVYGQFKSLTNWQVNENLGDWRLVSLDKSQLNKYSKGKIFELSKSFNDIGEPDYSGQKSLETAVKKALTNNGWKLIASPTEGSFYGDYLYVKDNHPLVLQIGIRDAVKGGMYISIQFQY